MRHHYIELKKYEKFPTCGHKMCEFMYNNNISTRRGVAVIVTTGSNKNKHILMGMAGFGRFAGNYVICSGKFDPKKDRCSFETALRELEEEYKLKDMERYLTSCLFVNDGFLFLFDVPKIDINTINKSVIECFNNAVKTFGTDTFYKRMLLTKMPNETEQMSEIATNGELQSLLLVPIKNNDNNKILLDTFKYINIADHCAKYISAIVQLLMTKTKNIFNGNTELILAGQTVVPIWNNDL